jgi:hypothetical protein
MSAIDVDALLAGAPARTEEERRLVATIDALRAAPPRAPEALRARVLALQSEPRRRPFLGSRRRTVLVLVAAALGIAASAAVVRGLTSSDGGIQRGSSPAREAAPATATAPAWTTATGSVGAPAVTKDAATAQGAPAAPGPTGGRLQRYEASITVRVPRERLSRATNAATRIARSLGGYAASVDYRTPVGQPGEAYLELRVPTARVQDALARLASLGSLISQRVSVEDLQADLERQTAQIAQLRHRVRALTEALKNPSLTPVQRVELQLRLADAKRSLAQRTHARKATIAAGSVARISLVLTAEKKSAIVPQPRGRLGRMLDDAVSFLALEGTVALYALIVLAPLLPLVALVWWAAVARRRRDERRLLAAPT